MAVSDGDSRQKHPNRLHPKKKIAVSDGTSEQNHQIDYIQPKNLPKRMEQQQKKNMPPGSK